jgi:predicted TPR repeat methyltransferase
MMMALGAKASMPPRDRPTEPAEEVLRLRRVLAEKPRHVRSMARLAVLLHTTTGAQQESVEATASSPSSAEGSSEDQSNTNKSPVSSSSSSISASDIDREAWDLARRAIECRPDLPYGYWAMSMIAADHATRMPYLRQAADRCDGVPHLLALSRLLLEPRQNEAGQIRRGQGTTPHPTSNCSSTHVGSASDEHPSRRPLSSAEEELYQQWNARLQAFYHSVDESSSSSSHEAAAAFVSGQELHSVAEREYGVGMMFRKMLPPEQYKIRCINHLKSSSSRFRPKTHPKAMLAQFWLSAVEGNPFKKGGASKADAGSVGSVTRCPPGYVVGLYSTFASRFDSLLVDKLSYQTPDMLRTLVDETVGPTTYKRTLDLGCGTGLSGRAFRSCVSACLRGVDLSPEMVDTARQNRPDCYDELLVGDVTERSIYAGANNDNTGNGDESIYRSTRWDLIYACDVFVYLGDLSPVFALVSEHLSDQDGVFAFSTELLHDEDSGDSTTDGQPYMLQSTGRFAHSVSYLNELAGRHNLCVRASTIRPIRKNAGKDILGCLMVLSKARSTSAES